MARDLKYGAVDLENEPDNLGDDEPVIVFRAQDALSVPLLARYANLYQQAQPDGFDLSTSAFLRSLRSVADAFEEWQDKNRDRVKLPD